MTNLEDVQSIFTTERIQAVDDILTDLAKKNLPNEYDKVTYNKEVGAVTFEVNPQNKPNVWIKTAEKLPNTTESILFVDNRCEMLHLGYFDGDLTHITDGKIMDGTNNFVSLNIFPINVYSISEVELWMPVPKVQAKENVE